MKINIAEIAETPGAGMEAQLEAPLDPIDYQGDLIEFTRPVSVKAQIHNTGKNLWANIRAEGEIELRCARCLEPVKHPVKLNYSEIFRQAHQEPVPDDDIRESVYSNDVIDLTGGFIEQLIFRLPMKVLCSEGCKGLCPQCGQDLNEGECGCDPQPINPKMAKLMEFFDKSRRE